MDNRTLRFLKSIKIDKIDNFSDLSIKDIFKNDDGSWIILFQKFNFWDYDTLSIFNDALKNIRYNYQMSFVYQNKLEESALKDFIDYFLLDNKFNLDFKIILNSHIKIVFSKEEEKEEFLTVKDKLESLLKKYSLNLYIEVLDLYDVKFENEKKKKVEKITDLNEKVENDDVETESINFTDDETNIEVIEEQSDNFNSTKNYENFVKESENKLVEEVIKAKEDEKVINSRKEMYKKSFNYKEIELDELNKDSGAVSFKGEVFQIDKRNKKSGGCYFILGIGSIKGAVNVTFFPGKSTFKEEDVAAIQVGNNIIIEGKAGLDYKGKNVVVNAQSFEIYNIPLREDHAKEKRVELHLHTHFSEMDAINSIEDYCELAKNMGHDAITVTDHGVVQSFPEAQKAEKDTGVKIIYGSELYMIPDFLSAAINPTDILLKNATYVVIDLETTGLSINFDRITEVGMVKMSGGLVVDRYDKLVNPGIEIPASIVEKTHISNEMVKNAPTMKEVFPEILRFIGDSILVTHNAHFDYEMLNDEFKRCYGRNYIHPVIDTLTLSRYIFPENVYHRLGTLCHRYGVEYDEESAHRADYDAQVLASCWNEMRGDIDKLIKNANLLDLYKLEYPKSIYKNLSRLITHAIVLARNKKGLKDLYKLISEAHISYMGKVPLTPRSLLNKYRKNLLVGSACYNGEVFNAAIRSNIEDLKRAISFYDYIEIQPLENYSFLINTGVISTQEELKKYLSLIIKIAKEEDKVIVATGDVHYKDKEDKIYRDILIANEAVGKIRHPLNPRSRDTQDYFENPDQHYRSTEEMLDCFKWLGEEEAYNFVVKNTRLISSLCEHIYPIPDKLFTPTIDNCENMLKELCYNTAHEQYGDPLPEFVENRLKKELDGIIGNGYSVTYYIAYKLVSMSNERGYIVGSRGSVGSSFAAYCAKITEVNALPPHYRCPKCKHFELHDMSDGITSGFDLPDKNCPECGCKMIKDGQNIPFETFLGFHADKVPDIDLNFPADFQSTAHLFTKDLLGEDKVFRAGTILTVKDKTAYGYVKEYFKFLKKDPNSFSSLYTAYLAKGCLEVKKTTGQHPGGIIVVPRDMDIYDFTPIQFPAGNIEADWQTTHFDFHAIHDTILKLDMLGHVDPQALKMMLDLTGVKLKDIPMDDKKVLSLFTCDEALNLKHKYLKSDIATTGLPEMGTNFVKQLVREAKPKNFKDLLIVSGLSHGTNVWTNNAQDIIKSGVTDLRGVIGCRDDIMTYLISKGVEPTDSFRIMEQVRKGKGLKDEDEKILKEHNVPDYYINSCKKIAYLFPKGHACAYIMMALRVGYFKVYYPLEYYATFFTLRCDQYDVKTMLGGIDKIHYKLEEFAERKRNAEDLSKKEKDIETTLIPALEFVERGYNFLPIDVNKSSPSDFIVDKERNGLIMPFKCLDSIGVESSKDLVREREIKPFNNIKDLINRGKINEKVVKFLQEIGCLDGFKEDDSISLFDY